MGSWISVNASDSRTKDICYHKLYSRHSPLDLFDPYHGIWGVTKSLNWVEQRKWFPVKSDPSKLSDNNWQFWPLYNTGSRMLSIIIMSEMPQLCCPLYYANDVSSATKLTFDGCHQLWIINQLKWFNCFIFSLHHSHFKPMHQSADWVTRQSSCINFPTHTVQSKQQFRNINSHLIFLS